VSSWFDTARRRIFRPLTRVGGRFRLARWPRERGKVVEIWNHRDDLGLMEQLGAQVHAGAPHAG